MWESILICMTVLATVLIYKINSIHFTSYKLLLHCFSSELLNVLRRGTSNLELSLEKSCRFSCACFRIKKACHVLLELEGILEVNCFLSNIKQESPLQYPQEWARRGGIDSVWGRTVTPRPQNWKGLSCDVIIQAKAWVSGWGSLIRSLRQFFLKFYKIIPFPV